MACEVLPLARGGHVAGEMQLHFGTVASRLAACTCIALALGGGCDGEIRGTLSDAEIPAADGARPDGAIAADAAIPDARVTVADAETADASDAAPFPTATGVYGPGINVDGKSNRRIGSLGSDHQLSHRFRASASSELVAIVWQRRLGAGYSLGTGGMARISVQTDDGTSEHRPSGTVLASLTYRPGNAISTGILVRNEFPSPATLTAGALYHIVFENTDPAPQDNYFSVNEMFMWDSPTPRQPAFSDVDYAVLENEGSGYREDGSHTADMDLVYASGAHDGSAYISCLHDHYGLIGGASNMVREAFVVSGPDRVVTAAWVRVGKQSGTGDLTIRLETGDGMLIEEQSVSSASIPSWTLGDTASATGGWVSVDFSTPRRLVAGQSYHLVLSAPGGTQISMVPLHHSQDNTTDASGDPLRSRLESRAFRDGVGEKTTNGGADWAPLYPYSPVNMQFYFAVAP